MALLFHQEFPEDDVSCFISTGDQYYDIPTLDKIAKDCHPPIESLNNLDIWFKPEKGKQYIVAIDPGQARVRQTSIVVVCFDLDDYGNYRPKLCARDAGLYLPELTARKATMASDYYNRAMITWEA